MRFADRISRGAAAAITIALIFIVTLTMARPAQAQTESVLYAFCALTGCADGAQPEAGVIMDAQGNLYGATSYGLTNAQGTIFKLAPDGTLTVLYTFCSVGGNKCSDGSSPVSGLIRDSSGDLFGTTNGGGAYNGGTVFKLSSDGTLTTLHSFNLKGTDGLNPTAGLVMDSSGNLYGTTERGGKYGAGTVYRITSTGKENIMHSFGATSTDGTSPGSVVPVMDRVGNLYGTTLYGGANGAGTVFEITVGGAESVLYSFGATPSDAMNPSGGLVIDPKGNLYGTSLGGMFGGTVFRVTHSGTETVMHNFKNNGTDGFDCYAPLVRDAAGNLYGVTYSGGRYGFGTVFEISTAGVETIVHDFANNGMDGANPTAGLLLDSASNLHGTTYRGGTHSAGTVFEVTP